MSKRKADTEGVTEKETARIIKKESMAEQIKTNLIDKFGEGVSKYFDTDDPDIAVYIFEGGVTQGQIETIVEQWKAYNLKSNPDILTSDFKLLLTGLYDALQNEYFIEEIIEGYAENSNWFFEVGTKIASDPSDPFVYNSHEGGFEEKKEFEEEEEEEEGEEDGAEARHNVSVASEEEVMEEDDASSTYSEPTQRYKAPTNFSSFVPIHIPKQPTSDVLAPLGEGSDLEG